MTTCVLASKAAASRHLYSLSYEEGIPTTDEGSEGMKWGYGFPFNVSPQSERYQTGVRSQDSRPSAGHFGQGLIGSVSVQLLELLEQPSDDLSTVEAGPVQPRPAQYSQDLPSIPVQATPPPKGFRGPQSLHAMRG